MSGIARGADGHDGIARLHSGPKNRGAETAPRPCKSLRVLYPHLWAMPIHWQPIDTGSLWAALRLARLRDTSRGKPDAGNGGKSRRRTAGESAGYLSVAVDIFGATWDSIEDTIHVVAKGGCGIDRVSSKVEHGSTAGVEL